MPKGVEHHPAYRVVEPAAFVVLSLMPKGVEHDLDPTIGRTISSGSFVDAERR